MRLKLSFPRVLRRVTNSMEQRFSWEADRFSTSQEMLRILRKPKVYYRIRKSALPLLIRNRQIQSMIPAYFSKISFNIIFPFQPEFLRRSSSLRFSHQNPESSSPLSHTCYMHCLCHSTWFACSNKTWRQRPQSALLHALNRSPVISSLSTIVMNIFSLVLFSNMLCSLV